MNLPDMPPSTDEYWEGAEIEIRKMDKPRKHEHVFELKSAREVQCKCGVGFFIGVGDRVKDGHLYHHDKLII